MASLNDRASSPDHPVTRSLFRARHAIVTLPLALLKAGAVAFDPPLPEAKRHAIDALTMAPAMKLLLRFEERFWDAEMTFLTGRDPVPVWWTVRRDAPLLTGFITGPRAARLAAHGPEGALEQGMAALTAIFGAAPRRLFAAGQVVDWAADEWARGGYSSVPPGAHGQRAVLAQPAGALHFAGEATVFANNPATVHGALHSGVRAAREIIRLTKDERRSTGDAHSFVTRHSSLVIRRLALRHALAVRGIDQRNVFLMPPDVAGDKRAQRHDRELARAGILQRSVRELVGDAMALQLLRHLRVREGDRIASRADMRRAPGIDRSAPGSAAPPGYSRPRCC